MKTISTEVFTFDELSDDAKEKARDWYREHALEYDWYESVYEDAAQVGLKITSFGLERDRHAKGNFTKPETEVANAIIANHGEKCETYKTAQAYLTVANGLTGESDSALLEIEDNDFLRSLLDDYSILLQHEYEYLLSDECVDDNIRVNEYTFTATGKRFG